MEIAAEWIVVSRWLAEAYEDFERQSWRVNVSLVRDLACLAVIMLYSGGRAEGILKVPPSRRKE